MTKDLPILFYNYFHNGDIFNSKPFVKEIIENIDVSVFYAHNANQKILEELKLKQFTLQQIFSNSQEFYNEKIVKGQEFILINTWIGAYFTKDKSACTLKFSYDMYNNIYNSINELYGTNLTLKENILEYFPTIDFNKLNLDRIVQYVNNESRKKVLICNGPGLSNQCNKYNQNMENIIADLATSFKDTVFICTDSSIICTKTFDNVITTDEIIREPNFDLNEISYLSTFCDIIVGRSSGPFSFSITKDNMLNADKKFICFGDKITDCFQHEINTNAKFIFEQFSNENNLLNTIKKEING